MKRFFRIRLSPIALLVTPFLFGACSPLATMNIPLNANAQVTKPAPSAEAQLSPHKAPPDPVPVDPNDDLSLGKRHFAQTNYGLAEQHFRRAVEKSTGPSARNAEAWLGLAASYDRLRRFDLADRAYENAIRTIGPTPEILNNQGYSFMLRRDYRKARAKFAQAQEKDPANPYILNNIALLEEADRPPQRAR
jgi:Flp pilus assembly protein TadD